VKFKLDENLAASAAAVLAAAGHDVDTVPAEDLTGAPDPDVVSAASKVGRILISLDIGLGDIRPRHWPGPGQVRSSNRAPQARIRSWYWTGHIRV